MESIVLETSTDQAQSIQAKSLPRAYQLIRHRSERLLVIQASYRLEFTIEAACSQTFLAIGSGGRSRLTRPYCSFIKCHRTLSESCYSNSSMVWSWIVKTQSEAAERLNIVILRSAVFSNWHTLLPYHARRRGILANASDDTNSPGAMHERLKKIIYLRNQGPRSREFNTYLGRHYILNDHKFRLKTAERLSNIHKLVHLIRTFWPRLLDSL